MKEYGLFTDEGCIFASYSEAEVTAEYNTELAEYVKHYEHPPAELYVAEICPDHEEQPREHCEECAES